MDPDMLVDVISGNYSRLPVYSSCIDYMPFMSADDVIESIEESSASRIKKYSKQLVMQSVMCCWPIVFDYFVENRLMDDVEQEDIRRWLLIKSSIPGTKWNDDCGRSIVDRCFPLIRRYIDESLVIALIYGGCKATDISPYINLWVMSENICKMIKRCKKRYNVDHLINAGVDITKNGGKLFTKKIAIRTPKFVQYIKRRDPNLLEGFVWKIKDVLIDHQTASEMIEAVKKYIEPPRDLAEGFVNRWGEEECDNDARINLVKTLGFTVAE